MPLTALRPDGSLLDATACGDAEWAEVHKPKVSAGLSCRDCGTPMHARVSSRGLRHLAHQRRTPGCPSEGESREHLETKRHIADLIRRCGMAAVVEAGPGPGDRGGWRADVLGVSPTGHRVAFEVQLAPMTVDVGRERTARYTADGIAVVWLTTKHARWVTRLPSAHLAPGEEGSFVVDRGLAKSAWTGWQPPPSPVPLERVVKGVLDQAIEAVPVDWFTEAHAGKTYDLDDAVVLVPAADLRAHEAAVRERDAHYRRQEQEAARHQAHLIALADRQGRLLAHALADVDAEMPTGGVWVGVPSRWWERGRPMDPADAAGNERTAFGIPIWVGPDPTSMTLWAVVCPVASRAGRGLGRSWASRGVQVYAETAGEAARIAQALGWPPGEIRQPAATPR